MAAPRGIDEGAEERTSAWQDLRGEGELADEGEEGAPRAARTPRQRGGDDRVQLCEARRRASDNTTT